MKLGKMQTPTADTSAYNLEAEDCAEFRAVMSLESRSPAESISSWNSGRKSDRRHVPRKRVLSAYNQPKSIFVFTVKALEHITASMSRWYMPPFSATLELSLEARHWLT